MSDWKSVLSLSISIVLIVIAVGSCVVISDREVNKVSIEKIKCELEMNKEMLSKGYVPEFSNFINNRIVS